MNLLYKKIFLLIVLCITSTAVASDISKSTETESDSTRTRKPIRKASNAPLSAQLSALLGAIENTPTAQVTSKEEKHVLASEVANGLSYQCTLNENQIVSSIKTTRRVWVNNRPRLVFECTALETTFNPTTGQSTNFFYKDLHALLIHEQLALLSNTK